MLSQMLPVLVGVLLVLIGLIVLYYVLIVRAILQMLRTDPNPVLLVFAFVACVFTPFTLVLGIVVLIIWRYHRRYLDRLQP